MESEMQTQTNSPKTVKESPKIQEDRTVKPDIRYYQLTTKAEVNGILLEPGSRFTLPAGVKGPHRTVVAGTHGANIVGNSELLDVPLYVELDPEIERERDEMRERHQQELNELDPELKREELLAKQREESRDLSLRAQTREIQIRQDKEKQEIEARHEAERQAFANRAQNNPQRGPAPPRELTEEELVARHKAENEALEARQKTERDNLEAQKAATNQAEPGVSSE
jgi:hypothetical protein